MRQKFSSTFRPLFILALLFSLISFPLLGEEKKYQVTGKEKRLVRIVTFLMQRLHYSKPAINDEVSEALFKDYLEYLDPHKYYFLAKDVQNFARDKKKLDNMLEMGNLDFVFRVYQVYLARLKERADFVAERIKEPFDFVQEENMVLDRSDESWVKNIDELNELWRKRIKNQLLQEKLRFLAEKEKAEKAKKEVEENSEGQTQVEKSEEELLSDAQEKIAKRFRKQYDFVKASDENDIIENYLSTFTRIFDPHSSYMNSRTLETFQIAMKLSLQGIGAVLTSEDGYPKIVSLISKGPADKQGQLKAGYLIVAVAQEGEASENVIDMPLNQVVEKIRGKKGTKVYLTVQKNLQDVPFEIVITRDEVKLEEQAAQSEIEMVQVDGKEKKIGIIKLPSFYTDFEAVYLKDPNARSTVKDVKKILKKMVSEDKISGLVVDLRYNSGGSLEEVIDLAGLFIPSGPVVQIKNEKKIEVREDNDKGFAYDVPLIVLVNIFSASASEIFAGVIQDYGRGVVIGSQTHGKGTVQNLLDLKRVIQTKDDLGAIKYTMAKFYRVTGASTQQKGVMPDITLPSFNSIEDYGEASLKHVIPWDEIRKLTIKTSAQDVGPCLKILRERHNKRMKKNKDFQLLDKYIEKWNERRKEKMVSLNIVERKKRQEEENLWYKNIEKMLGQQETKEEEEEKKDIYMEETIHVLKDLLSLKK